MILIMIISTMQIVYALLLISIIIFNWTQNFTKYTKKKKENVFNQRQSFVGIAYQNSSSTSSHYFIFYNYHIPQSRNFKTVKYTEFFPERASFKLIPQKL